LFVNAGGDALALILDYRFANVSTKSINRYREIVDRFEKIARGNLGKRASIVDLCGAAAVNQRTLLRAFRAIHGATPCHYMHALRLEQARQSLLLANGGADSVTRVAMRCGFRELGRFAVDYRAKFGESPSETLRRTSEP
jgi:transcriptional regulator GlxA family with amidase domain